MLSSATIWLRAPFQQLHRRATKVCHSNRSRWCVTGGEKHIWIFCCNDLEKRRSDIIFSTSGKKKTSATGTKSWEFVMKKDAPMDAPTRPGRRFEENVSGYSKGILMICWDLRFFEAKVIHLGHLTFEPPKNGGLEDDFSFSSRWFFRFHVNFQGCKCSERRGLVWSSWRLSQPVWKICSSNGLISLRFRGENVKILETTTYMIFW